MLQSRISLIAALLGLAIVGCGGQSPTDSSLSSSPQAFAGSPLTATPSNNSPDNSKNSSKNNPNATPPNNTGASNNAKSAPKAIASGDIQELEGETICGKARVLYAYGETANYRVYICANDNEPDRPRYYISRNKDGSGGLSIESVNYNPQKANAIEFDNDGYLYTLEAPTTQNPEPSLRVTFPNGNVSKEQLLRHLIRPKLASTNASNLDPVKYVLQNRESLGICQDNFMPEEAQNGMGSRAFPLKGNRQLVQIQCFPGAYQGAFAYVLWVDEAPRPRVINLNFDIFREPQNGGKPERVTEQAIAGIPRFNIRSQTLTNFTKFRGVGDCGSSSLYKLEGDRMVLQEFRAKYECDGEYVQDFPIVYPQ